MQKSEHQEEQVLRKTVLVLLLAGATTSLDAHHSRGHFDRTRSVEMKAVITKVGWVNPHVFLLGKVRAPDGSMQDWTIECHTINGQMRRGWTKRTVKVGDVLMLSIHPHRDARRLRSSRGGSICFRNFVKLSSAG